MVLDLCHKIGLVTLIITIFLIKTYKLKGHKIAGMCFFVCGMFILVVSNLHHNQNNDCLLGHTKQFEGIQLGGCIDVWHVYHLLFWMIIGMLVPRQYVLAFLIGVSWELLEHFSNTSEKAKNNIFKARYEDVIVNMIGYTIGSIIVTKNL